MVVLHSDDALWLLMKSYITGCAVAQALC